MRVIERTVYTVHELHDQFPKGYRHALDQHAMFIQQDFDVTEVQQSLAAIDKAAYYTRWARYTNPMDEGESLLTGRRAWAWLENVVLADLRIPWHPITRPGERRQNAKYGRYYRAGMVPPCPFTGVAYDDGLLDDLRDSIRAGMTVGDAMRALGDRADRMIEDEIEYQCSDEAFVDACEANDWEFYESGEMA